MAKIRRPTYNLCSFQPARGPTYIDAHGQAFASSELCFTLSSDGAERLLIDTLLNV